MFAWWGRTVYRFRYIVIGVMVALCVAGGILSLDLGKHVTQSGFFDDNSESVKASVLADEVYGRDRTSHVVGILHAPEGKTVTDPEWQKKVTDELNTFVDDHKDEVVGWVGWLRAPTTTDPLVSKMKTPELDRTFISVPLKGNNDDEVLNNYKAVENDLKGIDGGTIQLAGLNPLANELTGTIAKDQQRMEVLALPLVAIVLFFVFGGVIAAALPVIVGGLSIVGSLGIMRLIVWITGEPIHYFAQPVVTLIGLGIAIDYGLFVVSRFREEIAEGYDTEAAVRRTVLTAGRTVTFSAVLIVASLAGLLLFPQGFLKSLTYAGIASVSLSALLSITVLPAVLGILGRNVDALGVRTFYRIPIYRNTPFLRKIVDYLSDKTQKTLTREEVENGFWGRLVNVVMKRPLLYALPILIFMILLIVPLGKLALGGISEKYLPPDNPVRMAQEDFDRTFPGFRTEKITLVISNASPSDIEAIASKAAQISGFTDPTWEPRQPTDEGTKDPNVTVLQNSLSDRLSAAEKVDQLREIPKPKGVDVWVGGTPALEQDSVHSLFDKLPMMAFILVTTTTLLMFLAFGSVVLPIKAAVMSTLTLGSTLGILTWIFVDGHGSGLLNFTATPLTAPVIGLIIAVIYGLSTDYEVFLVSRMVEAREKGMSTTEAIRIGTATTGRIITAAALILVVVGGAFVFSDLVMLKYIAVGLIAALLLDATIIRMFLVPAIMKMLGDDCWWAPRWMKRIQNKIGMGEIHLPDERKRPVMREPEPALAGAGTPVNGTRPPHDPTHPGPRPSPSRAAPRRIPAAHSEAPSTAGTTRMPAPRGGHTETQTTRMPAGAPTANRTGVTKTGAPANTGVTKTTNGTPPAQRPAPPPEGGREIESWLGDLRSGRPAPGKQQPRPPAGRPDDAEPTSAIPAQRDEPARRQPTAGGPPTNTGQGPKPPNTGQAARPAARPATGQAPQPAKKAPAKAPAKKARPKAEPRREDETTTGLPVQRNESDTTEKMRAAAPEVEEEARRRGGGLTAAELLRREGRL